MIINVTESIMTSSETLSPDYRRHGHESKRDRDHRIKWAHGYRMPSSAKANNRLIRPNTASDCETQKHRHMVRHYNARQHNSLHRGVHMAARRDLHEELAQGPSDHSSGSDDNDDADFAAGITSPVPSASASNSAILAAANNASGDGDVFFSFDARRGPGQGSDLLSFAVTQAVQKFEHKETEKMAKTYEFVEFEDEDGDQRVDDGELADEDDFEIVGHVKDV